MVIPLSTTCKRCEGFREVYESPDYTAKPCPDCGGKGEVPTEAGAELLRFLSVHAPK